MSAPRGEYGYQNTNDVFEEDVVTQTQSSNHFSSLLWMPHQQHRSSLISTDVSH